MLLPLAPRIVRCSVRGVLCDLRHLSNGFRLFARRRLLLLAFRRGRGRTSGVWELHELLEWRVSVSGVRLLPSELHVHEDRLLHVARWQRGVTRIGAIVCRLPMLMSVAVARGVSVAGGLATAVAGGLASVVSVSVTRFWFSAESFGRADSFGLVFEHRAGAGDRHLVLRSEWGTARESDDQ